MRNHIRTSALALILAHGSLAAADPAFSLPFQLRPLTSASSVRIESAASVFNDRQGNVDIAGTTVVSGSYVLTEHWSPVARIAFTGNNAPGAALDGSSLANPVIGATYTQRSGDYVLALTGSTTLPIGTGGGDMPDARVARVNEASITARPADAAMFDVDYMTATLGVDAAYHSHGFTAQGELDIAPAARVRGSQTAVAADAFRTNSAVAVHVGYALGSHVSLGTDVRYQRWLVGERTGMPGADDDTLTVALGVRAHIGIGQHTSIHPGLSYTRGLDSRGFQPTQITSQVTALQIDVPVLF